MQPQEKFILELVINFVNYQGNKCFMQNKITRLKKKKFLIKIVYWQLIMSFADFWQNNLISKQQKKIQFQ